MAGKPQGRKEFDLLVHGQMRTFRWTATAERTAVMTELRAAGLKSRVIAKVMGISKSAVQLATGPLTYVDRVRANHPVKVRPDVYDTIARYALRHGVHVCDAADILISKGAEALNFKVDP